MWIGGTCTVKIHTHSYNEARDIPILNSYKGAVKHYELENELKDMKKLREVEEVKLNDLKEMKRKLKRREVNS